MPFPESQTIESTTYSLVDVKSFMREQIIAGFTALGHPELVEHVLVADPTEDAHIPCVAINRVDDQESETSLGDWVGEYPDPDDPSRTITVEGSYWSEVLEIRIWHFNPEGRDRWYQQLKSILVGMRHRCSFDQKGLANVRFSGGHDEQTSEFFGHPLFWGTIQMSYLNPQFAEVSTAQVVSVTVASVQGETANGNVTNAGAAPVTSEVVAREGGELSG